MGRAAILEAVARSVTCKFDCIHRIPSKVQQASNQTLAGALSNSIQNIQGLLPASKAELKSQVEALAALENRDNQLEKVVNLLVSKTNSLTPETLAPLDPPALLVPKVLAVGTTDAPTVSDSYDSADRYNPTTGTWAATGPLVFRTSASTAVLLPSGLVLAVGSFSKPTGAELYNPLTDTWTTTGAMHTPRSFARTVLLQSGLVLNAGGTSMAELYNPEAGTWGRASIMTQARVGFAMVLLPSGKVLAAGSNDPAPVGNSAQIWDPATNTWTGTGSMSSPRAFMGLAVLPSGKLLGAGAGEYNPDDNTAELYDPVAGTWTPTSVPMIVARLHILAIFQYLGALRPRQRPLDEVG
ncbi:g8958 [Coccomyxa elongata]